MFISRPQRKTSATLTCGSTRHLFCFVFLQHPVQVTGGKLGNPTEVSFFIIIFHSIINTNIRVPVLN
jgi:hypothetical protein